jgi:hypothetical protein
MAKPKTEKTETTETQPEATAASATGAADAAPTADKAPSYRVLVNPSGQLVAFRLDDPAYDYHLYMQRPPNVKPDKWFREPTSEELAAYVKKNPYA